MQRITQAEKLMNENWILLCHCCAAAASVSVLSKTVTQSEYNTIESGPPMDCSGEVLAATSHATSRHSKLTTPATPQVSAAVQIEGLMEFQAPEEALVLQEWRGHQLNDWATEKTDKDGADQDSLLLMVRLKLVREHCCQVSYMSTQRDRALEASE